jgi:SET domain-containing protein
LLAKECGTINPDSSSLKTMEINRLLLTLRYNGFESGLYLHFSMFNHDEDPNCIKHRPEEESEQKVPYNFSEARATRFVKKGEALTLHYQHRFDIGDKDVLFIPQGTFTSLSW